VVVDDFDLAAIDAPTARWNYLVQDLLLAAGRAPRDHVHGSPDDPPLVRWRSEHQHGGVSVHDGPAMLGALERAGLEQVEIARGPYLYRYATSIAHAASEDPVVRAIGEHVLATERRLLSEGVITPMGLRLVARRNG
jgi:hypothetical protein